MPVQLALRGLRGNALSSISLYTLTVAVTTFFPIAASGRYPYESSRSFSRFIMRRAPG